MARLITFFFILLGLSTAAEQRIIFKIRAAQSTSATSFSTIGLPQSVREKCTRNQANEPKKLLPDSGRTKVSTYQTFAEAKHSTEIDTKVGLDRIYITTIPENINADIFIAQLKDDPAIEYAEPDQPRAIFATVATPNESSLYTTYQKAMYDRLEAPAGWAISTGNNSVIIAIIDTGVSKNHEDLQITINGQPRVMRGYDYYNNDTDPSDDNNYSINASGVTVNAFGHGTQVAGHAAAIGNNGVGVCGVAWKARILPIKILNASGSTYVSYLIPALSYARANGAKVINMSFGGTGSSSAENDACQAAYDQGILLIAAMGNAGNAIVQYPAGYASVIGVGSVDKNDNLSDFSTYGSGSETTELVAPGGNNVTQNHVIAPCAFTISYTYANPTHTKTLVSASDGKYNQGSGTSFASPKVAGLAALMFAAHPDLTNEQIRYALHNSADDLGPVGYDEKYGFGRINIARALSLGTAISNSNPSKLTEIYNFPNPVTNGKTRFSFKSDKTMKKGVIRIYDIRGREIVSLETIAAGYSNGRFISGEWDCNKEDGTALENGTYIYVLEATDANDIVSYGKGKLTIVR